MYTSGVYTEAALCMSLFLMNGSVLAAVLIGGRSNLMKGAQRSAYAIKISIQKGTGWSRKGLGTLTDKIAYWKRMRSTAVLAPSSVSTTPPLLQMRKSKKTVKSAKVPKKTVEVKKVPKKTVKSAKVPKKTVEVKKKVPKKTVEVKKKVPDKTVEDRRVSSRSRIQTPTGNLGPCVYR
jgi:hypothetical protein